MEAFELIGALGVEFAVRNIPGVRAPLEGGHPWLVLIELASGEPGAAEAALERLLAAALADGLIRDAAIAQSKAQAAAFWKVREEQSAAQKPEGAVWKHDVSVPISKIAASSARRRRRCSASPPAAACWPSATWATATSTSTCCSPRRRRRGPSARRDEGAAIVHDIIVALDGSISAEHGLGAMKTAEALRFKSPTEVAAQRAIRAALDPNRIMNPRVLF